MILPSAITIWVCRESASCFGEGRRFPGVHGNETCDYAGNWGAGLCRRVACAQAAEYVGEIPGGIVDELDKG